MKPFNVLAMVSPMSSERVSGIARYAKEHGWSLMIQDRLGHTPLAWNGDGVIATLRSDSTSVRSIEALMKRGIPIVDLTISRPEIKLPRVMSDHRAIGRLAAQHFIERQFQNIAWFSMSWGNVHRLRYEGLCERLPTKPSKWILSEDLSARRQGDWSTYLDWLRDRLAKVERPLAVLTYDETDAARLLYGAKELNISVPEELAILSIGNNPLVCENQAVPLSSIDQNLERGGYEAAALLNQLMTRRASPASHAPTPHDILVPPAGIALRRSTDVIAVADPILRKALEFIGANIGRPIGSPQVAEAAAVPRNRLDRLFRETLSRSVGDEIRRQRFAKVRLLLKSTELSITQIAQETGYCTPSHLTNAFKSAFGLTPKDWRNGQ